MLSSPNTTAITQMVASARQVVSVVLMVVHQLFKGHLVAVEVAVLTNAVVHNHGIIDGVAQNGEHGRHKVAVEGNAHQHKRTEHGDQVAEQGNHRNHTGRQAADAAETPGDVQQNQHHGRHNRH